MTGGNQDGIGVLKAIWRKNPAGEWIVHDLKGVNLKPRDGFNQYFFKIADELEMLTSTPGDIMSNIFSTFGSTEFLVRQSIVPVVSWRTGDANIRCIGTGFFISATGLLITAAHVVRDPVDEGYAKFQKVDEKTRKFDDDLMFGVLLPINPAMSTAPFIDLPDALREAKCLVVPFEWTQHWGNDVESPIFGRAPEHKLDLDVAVCKVRQHPFVGPYQPIIIGKHRLKVGDRAVAIGYAEMKDIEIGKFVEPELVVSIGTVTEVYADNITEKHNSTPGPNFEFTAKIPGRMSGSPILVGSGIIAKGVVSRSWQDENLATGCLVAAIMDLPMLDGESITSLQGTGRAGIAVVNGPDV